MAPRDRQQAAETYLQWLRVGAVAVGLGAAITAGQGVAAATPSDSPDPQPASAAADDGAADNAAGADTDADRGSVSNSSAGPVPGRPSPDRPTSTVSAQQNSTAADAGDDGAESAADAAAGPVVEDDADLDALAEETAAEQSAATEATTAAATTAGSDSTARAEITTARDRGDESAFNKPGRMREHDVPKPPAALVPRVTSADAGARVAALAAASASAAPDSSHPDETGAATAALAEVATPPSPSANSVTVAAAPAASTPLTLNTIVTDLLRWIGWGQLATGLPVPAVPLPMFVESMWLVVRQTQYMMNPVGASYLTGQTTDPATEPAAGADPEALAELQARPGVDVSLNSDGTVDVIDGNFTDATVTTDAEAAQLLAELAPLLGAPEGWASVDNITVQRVGEGGPAPETFYRVRDRVGGVPVVGSEVILVTDGDGKVTGLFNNRDSRLDDVEMTPDTRLDDSTEAVVAAAVSYLLSAIAKPYLWATLPFMALSNFEPKLVVYSLDPDAPPELAWRVAVDPFNPLETLGLTPPQPSTTYFIDASGANAGAVLVENSAAKDLFSPATTSGIDVFGDPQTFGVDRLDLLFYHFDILTDLTRNISTWQWFGIGMPLRITDLLPAFGGLPVFQGIPLLGSIPLLGDIARAIPAVGPGLVGWAPSAVSAHVNMAKVYDYFKDKLGRTSFDGEGAQINVVTEFNPFGPFLGILFTKYQNAFWDPSNQLMAFGDGGDLEAALDVIGHEFTHAVVSHVIGQDALYGGESGALNEAYADILGNIIEGKTDVERWQLGEDSQLGVLRNMAMPGLITTRFGPYPAHYDDRYTGTEDDGGVHLNSTIFSHAAYLMMTSSATADVTPDTWADVFYRSLYRLSEDATFKDARAAILNTADETFDFTPPQLKAISDAFDEVGILAN